MATRFIAILGMAVLVGGCAIGQEYDYSKVQTNLEAQTDKDVAVSVVDQRQYVVSGDKKPNFVGLQRAGFGIPYDVTTQSGQPLARQMNTAVVNALQDQDITAEALVLTPGTDTDEALERFQEGASDRFLLVDVKEWKTDVYARMTTHWDLVASVYDQSGTRLAQNSISGVEPVSASALGLEDPNSQKATQLTSRKLEELLNDPNIQSALD
jgi:hypothetical protein